MNKTKLQMICTIACFVLSVLMFAATTIAYFSDTVQITNTLTTGDVSIELTEAAVKRDDDGNLVEDPDAPRIHGGVETTVRDYGTIYPGVSVFKDPTIKNTGDNSAWIAARITFTDGSGDLHKVIGYEGVPGIDMRVLLGGAMLDEGAHVGQWNGIDNVRYNDKFAIVQKADAGIGEYSFLIFFLEPFAPGEEAVLFDNLSIPADWTNEQMQELAELKIDIQAFGVQMFDLESCYEAMTSAFPTYFIH